MTIYPTNLLAKKQARKILFYTIFLFPLFFPVSLSAQNPLLLKSPLSGGKGGKVEKIISTSTGNTFFNTVDKSQPYSDQWGIWTTDGTKAGTQKLSLTSPGYISTDATMLTPLGNNKIVFAGDNTNGYGEIWVSDRTKAGTVVVEQFYVPSHSNETYGTISEMASMGNFVLYGVHSNDKHLQLRRTDGTTSGTTLVYDFGVIEQNRINWFTVNNGILYFTLYDIEKGGIDIIWRSDGTAAGTFILKDLASDYTITNHFWPNGKVVYFMTWKLPENSVVLFKTDGTVAGTIPVKTISPGKAGNNRISFSASIENTSFFAADDGIHGMELWKTDGTAAGTIMVSDINPGSAGSYPSGLTALNNVLYFSATAPSVGNELWKYDMNSGAGVIFVKDIFPGSTGSNPSNLAIQKNTILFSATRNVAEGNEFWITDGTNANTIQIANVDPNANVSSNPSLFTIVKDTAYFSASFDANGDGIADPCIYKYIAPQKIWTGNVSGNTSDANNWFPSGVPVETDNVIIGSNTKYGISNPSFSCNDLINNGGNINLMTGNVLVHGNFFNTGIVNNTNNGVFTIGHSSGENTIGNTGIFNGRLTISAGANLRLISDFKINDFKNDGGTVFLGPYNFQFDKFTNLPPRVLTDSSGSLVIMTGANPVLFGVGTDAASYTPVTITNNGTADYFSVNVKNGVYSKGTSGNPVILQAVNKTWNISKLNPDGGNATITLQWNDADELPAFNRNNVFLNHYTSGIWDSGTPGIASGSNPYTFSRSGFTSFSPFTITSSTSVLPLTILEFSATYSKPDVVLQWQTSSEQNTSQFNIERSIDGSNFSFIGKADAAGNNLSTKNYSYTDNTPAKGINFYRLKMIDAGEKFVYSKIVAVKKDDKKSLQLFPNPAKDILYVQASGENENALIQIFDLSGRIVKEQKIVLNGNSSLSLDISNLPKNIYNLILKRNAKIEQQRFVKD